MSCTFSILEPGNGLKSCSRPSSTQYVDLLWRRVAPAKLNHKYANITVKLKAQFSVMDEFCTQSQFLPFLSFKLLFPQVVQKPSDGILSRVISH